MSRSGPEIERLYALRFSKEERRRKAAVWATLADVFFSRYVPPNATVLDLGAGDCELLNRVRAARRIAIDLNPATRERAAPDVEVHAVPLERLEDAVALQSVDVAFASNVLEHLRSPEELLGVLQAVERVLRPGGRLIVLQPNVRLVGAAFWDFFDHTLPLTERGMAEALETSGLHVVEQRARFLPYTVKSRLPAWPILVRAYLAFPAAQWLLGKQMLLIAEKQRR